MSVCCLTEVQARELEHRGIVPECRNLNGLRRKCGLPPTESSGNHLHVSYKEAKRHTLLDLGDGAARWVVMGFAITFNTKRGWNKVRDSMQMTREISGFRHVRGSGKPIPAAGAHGRNTSVYVTNNRVL
jgi:hypothetical protein